MALVISRLALRSTSWLHALQVYLLKRWYMHDCTGCLFTWSTDEYLNKELSFCTGRESTGDRDYLLKHTYLVTYSNHSSFIPTRTLTCQWRRGLRNLQRTRQWGRALETNSTMRTLRFTERGYTITLMNVPIQRCSKRYEVFKLERSDY